tara:strand:- start:820 stop:1413 length:594 start_codon:yes stop_codon:yes gene_type:complete
MEPIDVYLIYCAMKAHFGNTDYDFITYKGKSRVSRDSFYKRKDRFFFVKLSRKYKEYNEIRDYFISNFIKDRKGYISSFNDENYENWKTRRHSFYNIFIEEIKPFIKEFNPLFKVKKSEHPKLMKEFLGGRLSLETLIVLDELVKFTKKWNQKLKDDIVWLDLKKLMNDYKRFLTIDKNKYRIQLLNLIEESGDNKY